MPTRLNKDFQPSEQTYNNLRKHGAIPEFVDHEMEMFMAYFLGKAEQWESASEKERTKKLYNQAHKEVWQMTCQRWMREQWKGKAGRDWEYNRHRRQDKLTNQGLKNGDLFEYVHEKITDFSKGTEKCSAVAHKRIKPKYRIPERPAIDAAPMKPEDAFAQLRNSGVIK